MHNRILIPTTSNKMLYISLTTIDSSFQTDLHSHENLEILLVIDGIGYIQTNNRKINVKKGDLVIINPNSKHCEISYNLTFYAIGINNINVFLEETFTKKIIHFSLNEQDFLTLKTIYSIILNEGNKKYHNYVEIIENLVDNIFLLIERYRNITTKENNNVNISELVNNIVNIINYYYYTDIKLDDIAYRLSQSKSTICHSFKKEMGISIIQYKINKQLEESCNLLEITDMTISAISSVLGFNSTAYFTKCFNKAYGISPKMFRKAKRNLK